MSRPLATILELQETLRDLERHRQMVSEVPESMRELHERYQEQERQILELEESALNAEQERRAAEGEAVAHQEKESHYREQVGKVTTQREYGALLNEIDSVHTLAGQAEETALAAIEQKEEAETEIERLKQEFAEVQGEYDRQLAEWEASKPDLRTEIDRLEGQVEVLKEGVPRPMLAAFERLYERFDGEPMAQIVSVQRPGSSAAMWRCGVCNYSVRPQVVVQVQNGTELVNCDCGKQRIFYLED